MLLESEEDSTQESQAAGRIDDSNGEVEGEHFRWSSYPDRPIFPLLRKEELSSMRSIFSKEKRWGLQAKSQIGR